MKYFFQIILFLFTIKTFSQAKGQIKLTREKINNCKTVCDLISEIPKDCTVNNFIFTGNVNSQIKELKCEGKGFSTEARALMNYFEKGKSFFIEQIKSSCQKSHKNKYEIIVD